MKLTINQQEYSFTHPTHEVGAPLSPWHELLTSIVTSRLRSRLSHFANKNPAAQPHEIQAELLRMAAAFEFDDSPEPDLIEEEAIAIAEGIIRAKLATQGLPPPKSLRDHALQLIDHPNIVAEAQRRVRARIDSAREILEAVA